MGEGETDELVGTDEFEDAVDAVGVEGFERGVEVGFQDDVVGACLFQFGDLFNVAGRGNDGAVVWVVFGEEDSPEADAAGSAVHEDGGLWFQLRGFEEGAPGCPHAHENAAEDGPGEGGGREGEAAPRVADGVLGVGAVVGFAAAVDPASDVVARFEGGGGAGCFDDADEFLA